MLWEGSVGQGVLWDALVALQAWAGLNFGVTIVDLVCRDMWKWVANVEKALVVTGEL
jgi:hypothetical protein